MYSIHCTSVGDTCLRNDGRHIRLVSRFTTKRQFNFYLTVIVQIDNFAINCSRHLFLVTFYIGYRPCFIYCIHTNRITVQSTVQAIDKSLHSFYTVIYFFCFPLRTQKCVSSFSGKMTFDRLRYIFCFYLLPTCFYCNFLSLIEF